MRKTEKQRMQMINDPEKSSKKLHERSNTMAMHGNIAGARS